MPSYDANGDLMGFRFTIENNVSDELLEMFDEIKEWQHSYLQEVAQEVADTASNLAPSRTGRLQNSIYYVEADPDNMAPAERIAETRTEYKIGTDVYYGRWMEFGWVDQYGNYHSPFPFLRPALYSVTNKINKDAVNRELSKFLRSKLDQRNGRRA